MANEDIDEEIKDRGLLELLNEEIRRINDCKL